MDNFNELCRLLNLYFGIVFPVSGFFFFLLSWVNNIELLLFFICSFILMPNLGFNVKIKVWEGICGLKVDGLIAFCTLIAISHFDLQGHSHKFRDYYVSLGRYVLSNLLTMNIKHNIKFVSTKMVSSHTLYIKETKETWISYSYIFLSFFHSCCNRETELS